MRLRYVFLLTTRLAAWLRLSGREETWQTAEILILRHQLAVLQRRQPRCPKLNWADRALLATLLSVIPKAHRHGLRLLVTPGHDPALAPRHHPAPLGGAVRARQDRPTGHPPEHRGPGPPAGPGEPRLGLPPDPRRDGQSGSQGRGVDRMGDPQDQRHGPRAATDRADLVTVPALPGPGDPGLRLVHGRPAQRAIDRIARTIPSAAPTTRVMKPASHVNGLRGSLPMVAPAPRRGSARTDTQRQARCPGRR